MKVKHKLFKSGITLVVSLLFCSNLFSQTISLQTGLWQGTLTLHRGIDLPFNFSIQKQNDQYSMVIFNDTEKISVDEVYMLGDSIIFRMPVFDSELHCRANGSTFLEGFWLNFSRKDHNRIHFDAASLSNVKLRAPFPADPKLKGKWEASFSPQTQDSTKAIGVFHIDHDVLSGTFLTETGDYRFLSGQFIDSSSFYLSCFDGSHAFLFKGEIKGDSIVDGHFYSGSHHHEPWLAIRNDKFELRNPDSLTYLKSGYSGIDFNFKNTEGKNVSLKDEKFKNKVVIIQLTGTWCPNCMDETKFLAPFYEKYKSKGLEIVALAFERTEDFAKAVSNVERTKKRFNASYEFLITGKTGAAQASQALPMLNKVMAFPTTIYIDKKGRVRKIYTGFYGPATGDAHLKFVDETTRFVEKLLAE
ncbi:MAG: Peroxiredoxin [Bacteroidetes bacterium]|jgi:thiol-disulfide isomerase/thioredoxin|nr:Peroxiredoxin [Bacteroidota bacterium]